jgi:hypothetical protein
MLVEIARLTLSQRRDSDAISSASLEFSGDGVPGLDHMAVAPRAPSQGEMPSSTPHHRHSGGATPSHVHREHIAHTHHAHATHHGHHPLVARRKPTPAHHHGSSATPGHHATPSPSADVSPHAFANGMGATMPAASRQPLDRPHVEHHHEQALYPSQQGAVRAVQGNPNQRRSARITRVHSRASGKARRQL